MRCRGSRWCRTSAACAASGHLRDDLEADEDGEREDRQLGDQLHAPHAAPPPRRRDARVHDQAVVRDQRSRTISSSSRPRASLRASRRDSAVGSSRTAGSRPRHRERQIERADDRHAVLLDVCRARSARSCRPPRRRGRRSPSPARMLARPRRDQPGAGRPGIRAVVITTSGSRDGRRAAPARAGAPRRELPRVAAGRLGVRAEVELEEPRAERLDLLLHRGPDVEGCHDGAEPPRRRDRLQARDAGAEHQHAGRA